MEELMDELIRFQKERDWKKFHTPENLAKSISIEAAELLEHFQWDKEYDVDEVAEELADVLIYSLYLADSLNLDIKSFGLKLLIISISSFFKKLFLKNVFCIKIV